MPNVEKSVDKIYVNNSEQFIYTYKISFSDLTNTTSTAVLKEFFPSKILYILPSIESFVKEIREVETSGGTIVEFDFDEVVPSTYIEFMLTASFGPGRVNDDIFTNSGDLYINNIKTETSTAETVNLILSKKFTIKKSIYPKRALPNEIVSISLILSNTLEAGAKINNIIFTDILPIGLTPVTSFTPTGRDMPYMGYSDPTYNDLKGYWTENTMNFILPNFQGANYQINFQARVNSDISLDTVIKNQCKWSIDGEVQTEAQESIFVEKTPSDRAFLQLNKQGPHYAIEGDDIFYKILFNNTGTVELNNIVIEDNIPKEVDIFEVRTTVGKEFSSYSIDLSTSEAPTTLKKVVDNASGSITTIDLLPYIPKGSRIVYMKLEALSYGVSNSFIENDFILIGKMNNNAKLGASVDNIVNYKAESSIGEVEGIVCISTKIQEISKFKKKEDINPSSLYEILDKQHTDVLNVSKLNPKLGRKNVFSQDIHKGLIPCSKAPIIKARNQSINDLIQSVALEQSAISHILNAEGEKISKAIELDISEVDLLKVNDSVVDMINIIIKYELVLKSKVSLFADCNLFKCDCDIFDLCDLYSIKN